jgi:hypothetical protein
MPRIIRKTEPRHPRHKQLVKELVRELTSPGDGRQPLILEEHSPSTKLRVIYVIWDAFEGSSFEERNDIILDAYKQIEGESTADNVVTATGLTAEEAVPFGLLPYRVEPKPRKTDRYTADDYARVMAEEAKQTLLGAEADELRYVRLEDAEEARRRLKSKLPGSNWVVQHDEALD